MEHNHNHGHGHHHHGGGCHEESKDTGGVDLYPAIDTVHAECFNAESSEQVQKVFRPLAEKLNFAGALRSDDDVELLIRVPFTKRVKIKTITLIGGEDGTAPSKVKLYTDLAAVDMSVLEDTSPV